MSVLSASYFHDEIAAIWWKPDRTSCSASWSREASVGRRGYCG